MRKVTQYYSLEQLLVPIVLRLSCGQGLGRRRERTGIILKMQGIHKMNALHCSNEYPVFRRGERSAPGWLPKAWDGIWGALCCRVLRRAAANSDL